MPIFETLEENGRVVQGLADLLTERITPVYRKYATLLAEGTRTSATAFCQRQRTSNQPQSERPRRFT